MAIRDAFNQQYAAQKFDDNVLSLYHPGRGGGIYIDFDFLTRTMQTHASGTGANISVIPFSQLDPEVVIELREKLVELGGNPQALSSQDAVQKPASNQLKL